MKTHWISGSGEHGCLYDHMSVSANHHDAVEDLAILFELGNHKRRELSKLYYLELGPSYGAAYCEIIECNCGNLQDHFESTAEYLDFIASYPECMADEEEENV